MDRSSHLQDWNLVLEDEARSARVKVRVCEIESCEDEKKNIIMTLNG